LLGRATTVVAGLLEVIVLVYLMLAAGNMLFRKMVKLLPAPDDLRTATDILNKTERIVANYLTITALINVGQGIAVGLAMWAIGMPDPFIWGVVTFVLEFIPYLGGVIIVGLLLIDGFSVFPTLGQVLVAPAIYLVISMIQNNVVSPYAYGNRLKLNPLAVMIFCCSGGSSGGFRACSSPSRLRRRSRCWAIRCRGWPTLAELLGG